MSLNSFFAINLPYGLLRDENDEWEIFNREYIPLGFTDTETKISDQSKIPIRTKYNGLTEKLLIEIAAKDGKSIERDSAGKIRRVWLYNDNTNPMNQPDQDNPYWAEYWSRLEKLSRLMSVYK